MTTHTPATSVEIALSISDIVIQIISYHPVHTFSKLSLVGRTWDTSVQLYQRYLSCNLLSISLTQTHRNEVARQIEVALYTACGSRSGPGVYNKQLKILCSNLAANKELRGMLLSGALLPRDLVRMNVQQLQSESSRQYAQEVMKAFFHAREFKDPPPNVCDVAECGVCGSRQQWRIAYLRAGSEDVTKHATKYVCVQCNREVFVNPADFLGGGADSSGGEGRHRERRGGGVSLEEGGGEREAHEAGRNEEEEEKGRWGDGEEEEEEEEEDVEEATLADVFRPRAS